MPPPGAVGSGPAQDLIPRCSPLAGGDGDAAGELQEAGGLGDHGARVLDAEQQLIAFVKLQRIADALWDRDLSLRCDSRA